MELEGRVIKFLGETSGTSKAGNLWRKKEWVIETPGQYPRKVKVQCMGSRVDAINLELNKDYVLSVDVESREFNDRWYTDVSVFRAVETMGQPQGVGMPGGGYGGGFSAQQPQPQQPPFGNNSYPAQDPAPFSPEPSAEEDLPF